MTVVIVIIRALRIVPEILRKDGRTGNQGKHQDHPNESHTEKRIFRSVSDYSRNLLLFNLMCKPQVTPVMKGQ